MRLYDIGEVAARCGVTPATLRYYEELGLITQLDGVTQQNAAMVEETTAAAQMLDTDANTLNGLTAVFSLTDRAGARFRRKDEADGDKGSIFAFPEGNLASADRKSVV